MSTSTTPRPARPGERTRGVVTLILGGAMLIVTIVLALQSVYAGVLPCGSLLVPRSTGALASFCDTARGQRAQGVIAAGSIALVLLTWGSLTLRHKTPSSD